MSDTSQRRCLYVIGAHRSGTSALAGLLGHLGLTLPTELRPADLSNPTGYWESARLGEIDAELLRSVGSRWDDVRPVDTRKLGLLANRLNRARISNVLTTGFGTGSTIVVKDPLICRLGRFHISIAKSIGYRVAAIHITRNPYDVVESLTSKGLDRNYALLLWIRYQLEAESTTRRITRTFVSYEALLDDWRAIAGKLADIGLEVPDLDQSATAIDGFIHPNHRSHSRGTAREVDDIVRAWTASTVAAFELLSQDPSDQSAIDELERVRAGLDSYILDLPTVTAAAKAINQYNKSALKSAATHLLDGVEPLRTLLVRTIRAGLAPIHLRQMSQLHSASLKPGPDHEGSLLDLPADPGAAARVFAYYLPQFHRIPENDEWWGPGFTEWSNVARGLPRFSGHVQPRAPLDLGYYDLSHLAPIRAQIELAKRAGLTGFCFYYYRFGDRRLLERPLDLFLDSDLDFQFCLMWANETWSRRWDGRDDDVLMQQLMPAEGDGALVEDLERYLRDPRYETIDGRPIMMIYRPDLIPNSAERLSAIRVRFVERHGLDPVFVMAQTFEHRDPRELGFDAAVEGPKSIWFHGLRSVHGAFTPAAPGFEGWYLDYSELVRRSLAEPEPDYHLIRCAIPSWDSEPRRPGRGLGFVGSSPARYEEWLSQLVERARTRPFLGHQPYVMVNAWNEWAEGAVLEPDRHYGYAHINATRRAVTQR